MELDFSQIVPEVIHHGYKSEMIRNLGYRMYCYIKSTVVECGGIIMLSKL